MTHGETHFSRLRAGIIVAAGAGRRMGFDKVIAPLAGRPVVCWSLQAFEECGEIDTVVLVCAPGRVEEFRILASRFSKVRQVVAGGAERRDSVGNGLDALSVQNPSLVLVHDAARPLVTAKLITEVVLAAEEHGAASAAEPVNDTLHRASTAGGLSETVSRSHLWAMQTPQAARYSDLRGALKSAADAKREVTDEVSALIAAGIHPRPVPHAGLNFKITWPRDLELAQTVLARRLAG